MSTVTRFGGKPEPPQTDNCKDFVDARRRQLQLVGVSLRIFDPAAQKLADLESRWTSPGGRSCSLSLGRALG